MAIDTFLREKRPSYRVGKVVHVGAHTAQEAHRYDELSPESVTWIEGDPQNFELLKARLHELSGALDAQQYIIEAAISDTDGSQARIHRFSNQGMSNSLYEMTPLHRVAYPEVVPHGEPAEVTTAKLDTVLKDHPGAQPDILVIDIQGSELDCLKGAEETLRSVRFLECEVSTKPTYEGGVLFDELNRFLVDKGFTLRTDVPWHGDVVYERVRPAPLRQRLLRVLGFGHKARETDR